MSSYFVVERYNQAESVRCKKLRPPTFAGDDFIEQNNAGGLLPDFNEEARDQRK